MFFFSNLPKKNIYVSINTDLGNYIHKTENMIFLLLFAIE